MKTLEIRRIWTLYETSETLTTQKDVLIFGISRNLINCGDFRNKVESENFGDSRSSEAFRIFRNFVDLRDS